jgi:hypothetical protein
LYNLPTTTQYDKPDFLSNMILFQPVNRNFQTKAQGQLLNAMTKEPKVKRPSLNSSQKKTQPANNLISRRIPKQEQPENRIRMQTRNESLIINNPPVSSDTIKAQEVPLAPLSKPPAFEVEKFRTEVLFPTATPNLKLANKVANIDEPKCFVEVPVATLVPVSLQQPLSLNLYPFLPHSNPAYSINHAESFISNNFYQTRDRFRRPFPLQNFQRPIFVSDHHAVRLYPELPINIVDRHVPSTNDDDLSSLNMQQQNSKPEASVPLSFEIAPPSIVSGETLSGQPEEVKLVFLQ